MGRRFRLPMFVVAAAMFALLAVLATLQYKWLGRVSDAERERMSATLNLRAAAFAQDFDRELTRAYLLFQTDAGSEPANPAARLATRFDRWQTTARFPRMIGTIYVVSHADGGMKLERFNQATRLVEPADWPDSLRQLKAQLTPLHESPAPGGLVIRPAVNTVLEDVPAIVVATPVIFFEHRTDANVHVGAFRLPPPISSTVLVLDREYIVNEMLPAIAEQHFRGLGDGVDYQLAVVRHGASDVVYRSSADFTPSADGTSDAATDLFQVRPQEFGGLAAEVRRFATIVARPQPGGDTVIRSEGGAVRRERILMGATPEGPARTMTTPRWRLLVTHPSGSLEAAVRAARARNVLVSSGIVAVLGASMVLLVATTRRSQRLAEQQMEFVAAVSHELRTPLAVIRSAGENLADGVILDEPQIRKYGDLVRNEGRRLSEMVEQTLELAGIHSGQRGFVLRPVAIRTLVDGVLSTSELLGESAGVAVEIDVPEDLPPVLGDEPALRRVFQNLIANALKYGDRARWLGVRAHAAGRDVVVSVRDRGIGIAPAEHEKIFEPFYRTQDVVAAQIHGAGLGLSLVKRIVEAHGGRISVRSAPGEGSEFVVSLPAAGREPAGADEPGRSGRAAQAAGVRS